MAAGQAFTGAGLDRATALRRDAGWVRARRQDPTSRAIAATRDGVLVVGEQAPRLVRLPLEHVPGGAGTTVLLGLDDEDRAVFAVDVDQIHGRRPLAPGARPLDLRDAAALLPADEASTAAYAASLLSWHRTHTHCARCGGVTDEADAGHKRTCPICGGIHHPRTDPIAIVLVHDGDRVLLGRDATWPPGRYSALAGFVEVGETLEAAVVREVAEEAGVVVRDPRYVGSQPWPFPSSLMVAFTAAYASGEPAPRDGELDDVRWFDRAQVAAAAARPGDAPPGALELPPPFALGRQLIERWLR